MDMGTWMETQISIYPGENLERVSNDVWCGTWAVKKAHEKLNVAEMTMLRWMSGVAKLDRIRNERIRGTTCVTMIV